MDTKFQKGHDPRRNTKGRPKGEAERVRQVRELVGNIIEENLPLIQQDLKKMRPRQRAEIIERLLRFYLPTLKSLDLSLDVDIMKLNDQDIERLANQIIRTHETGSE